MVRPVRQDLSQAGRREGLAGERSGLFFDYVRIIKEMREHDRSTGRTNEFVRPRFCVFENVPGLLSSADGKDFQTVLTEIARIANPNAADVPMPNGRWAKAGIIYGMGQDGLPFSIAYKIHDSQYWGVPQRRRRLALVGDFNGLTAGEILFDPKYRRETKATSEDETFGSSGKESRSEVRTVGKGVSWDSESCEDEEQTFAEGTGDGVDSTITFQERAGNSSLENGTPSLKVFESHDQDSRYNEFHDVCETVNAKYGTGGGQRSDGGEY